MLDALSFEPEALRLAYSGVMAYFAMVRDYEIFGPKTKTACEEHTGRKTEIVGWKHVDPLARYMRSDSEKPDAWQNFIGKQDRKTKKALRTIERLAKGKVSPSL